MMFDKTKCRHVFRIHSKLHLLLKIWIQNIE